MSYLALTYNVIVAHSSYKSKTHIQGLDNETETPVISVGGFGC